MRLKYNRDLLVGIVAKSSSVSDVVRGLGLKLAGGNHSHIKKKIDQYGIDATHFKKKTEYLRPGVNKRSAEDILVLKTSGNREHASRLRRAIIESGIEYKCVYCPIRDIWNGKPIILEVHHKNGNWLDNRKKNLELVCPNCHQQAGVV